jgi:peptidyl-prolyl cis-trans isomerase D
MLESFRNLLSGKTLYVIVGICAVPFIFTGVSSFGTIFSNYGTVNGLEVTQLDVNSASGTIEQRYKSVFGDSFSLDQLEEEELFNLLKSQIVNQKIIESTALENRLGVSINDAKREIIKLDSFKNDNGVFDQAIFESTIRSAGLIPDEYIELVASSIASDNLVQAISNSFFILEDELKDFIAANEVSRDIKFLRSNTENLVDLQPASLVEAEKFYNENNLLFLSNESRVFKFIKSETEDYLDRVTVTEELLEESYQDYLNAINNSIQNRISHIMIEKSNFASELEAQEFTNNILVKINSKEITFESAVVQYTDDEASKETNGDLGFSSGDAFPEEFENVITRLNLNEISDPIDLGDTLHLIKLTETLKSEAKPKKQVLQELKSEILESESTLILNEDIALAEDLIISGSSLDEIAKSINIIGKSTNAIDSDQFSDVFQGLRQAKYFAPSFIVGDLDIAETENGFYIIELIEIIPPSLMSLDGVRKEKAEALIRKIDESAFELINSDEKDLPVGFEIEEYQSINRFSSLLPTDVLSKIFSSSVNDEIKASAADGNNYWIKIKSQNLPSELEVTSKLDEYRTYFDQYTSQKNSSLVDEKVREGLRVDLKNLEPQS